jgi:hypothetical protein
MWTLTILLAALVVAAAVAGRTAANRRGRRLPAHWQASLVREDALRGGKA